MNIYLKNGILVLLLFLSHAFLFGQRTNEIVPYIEITGSAEEEFVPDEIYIKITIKERFDGRNKLSVEEQESALLEGFKEVDIEKGNIKLNDVKSRFVKVKALKKDVIELKIYEVKASNSKEVVNIFKVVNDLKIQGAFVTRISHSQIDEYKKKLRIKAIKDAKERAEFLVEAIGNKLGLPLIIKEQKGNKPYVDGLVYSASSSNRNATEYYIDGIQVRGSTAVPEPYNPYNNELKAVSKIEYQTLKLYSSIYVKFQVE